MVAVTALFLNQYPKIWLDPAAPTGPPPGGGDAAAGLHELRVAAALVAQRLGMVPASWSAGHWWSRLGLVGRSLPAEFSWARVLAAVDRAEDVFRGISPTLPARW